MEGMLTLPLENSQHRSWPQVGLAVVSGSPKPELHEVMSGHEVLIQVSLLILTPGETTV